jgi:recombinational DNA repair protein (RecF pathway)
MAHTIYKTDAFVVGAHPRGEASAVFTLFTQTHGLIAARAQSVRRGPAKLKHALNKYKKASCSLVRGKNGWRLIDAEELPLSGEIFTHEIKREVYAKLLQWVVRFQGHEEEARELYEDIIATVLFLETHTLNVEEAKALEVCIALLVLNRLGYISREEVEAEMGKSLSDFIFNPHDWRGEHLPAVANKVRPLVALINNGIAASNL